MERTTGPIVVSRTESGGSVVVIGDTATSPAMRNLDTAESSIPDNIRFWRWLLSRVVGGTEAVDPPPNTANANSAEGKAAAEKMTGNGAPVEPAREPMRKTNDALKSNATVV